MNFCNGCFKNVWSLIRFFVGSSVVYNYNVFYIDTITFPRKETKAFLLEQLKLGMSIYQVMNKHKRNLQ
jgi:hypothetical protein